MSNSKQSKYANTAVAVTQAINCRSQLYRKREMKNVGRANIAYNKIARINTPTHDLVRIKKVIFTR